ncbi:MAG: response regulator [Clostridiaceae bacterium]|nr:response regulator [Eubacteriales bacterium]
MKNYKAMIVDDEAEVREGIVARLDWEALGFEVVAEAENGLEAIEKAEANEVELLLTDIKMPFMDGLTMIAEFRTLHPSAKVVILSGFDDADYARQAIKLGVTEYALKPVNAEELAEVISRMKAQLDREYGEKLDIAALREKYERALPVMKERFLSELLWRRMSAAEIAAGVAAYDLEIDAAPGKLVLVFDIAARGAREQPIEGDLVPISISQLVEETLSGRCRTALCPGLSQIVAITAWEGADPVSRAVLLGNDIAARCKRILDVRVTCGVSKRYDSLTGTPDAYTEARNALEYRGEPGLGRAIYIGDAETGGSQGNILDERNERLLLNAVRAGSFAQMAEVAEGLALALESLGADSWQRQAYLVSLCNSFNRIVMQYGLSGEAELTERIASRMGTVIEPEGVRAWLTEVCTALSGCVTRRRESAPKLLAEKAARFIAERYGESSLSAEDVCAHLHVSRSYFFEVFKKEMGRSFVQYLTDVRMERALDLLRDPEMKTITVAYAVGYEEPNYFSHVFKRRFGVTPARFRRQETGAV